MDGSVPAGGSYDGVAVRPGAARNCNGLARPTRLLDFKGDTGSAERGLDVTGDPASATSPCVGIQDDLYRFHIYPAQMRQTNPSLPF